MANTNGWTARLRSGLNFTHPIRRTEQKWTPLDPTVNYQYIEHLVYTANTIHYGGEYGEDGNSAVFACLRALADADSEAPLRVYRKIDGEFDPVENSPIEDLLDEPHPDLDILEIRWWISWVKNLCGNAYLLKVRSGDYVTGNVVELWPVNPRVMRPHTEQGSNNFIDWYEMDSYDGKGIQEIPKENVIHFKMGTDPKDPRKGISPIQRLLREIAGDGEATRYQDAILRNFGAPGLVATMPSETMLSPKQIEELKHDIERRFSGDRRGSVGVMTGGAKMEQFGFSPTEMNLKILHDQPETRIAAVMGVDPLVARLGVGLEQSSNYASSRQVRENFTELTVVPAWKRDGMKWTRGLAREFTQDRNVVILHDLSEVRSLQEDENEKAKRIIGLFAGGLVTREEGRRDLGYDPEMANGEIVALPNTLEYVTVEQAITDVEAEQAREDAANQQRAEALRSSNQNAQNSQPAGNQAEKAFGTDERMVRVLEGLVQTSLNEMATDLKELQDSQQKRVKKALVDGIVH